MSKSKVVCICSIAGAFVLAAIGLTLLALNWVGANGHLAGWPVNGVALLVAYGCLLGPIAIAAAIGLLRSGLLLSDNLHKQEVRDEKARFEARSRRDRQSEIDAEAWAGALAAAEAKVAK